MYHRFMLLAVLLIFGSPSFSSAAGWELYDDFSSGTIDSQKWNNASTVSTISVENQRLKVIHLSGHPNKSGWLQLVQDPANILGIKASITVSSCTGDVRTRLGGYSGKIGANDVWSALQLQPGYDRIYSFIELDSPSPDYQWINDLHYGQFRRPIELSGNTYTVSMLFSTDKITYEVGGLGKIIYRYATNVSPTVELFRGIGTRSTNGDGPCTSYVDNVYVFRP